MYYGYPLFFLFLCQNIHYGCSLEVPLQSTFNEYNNMFSCRNKENINIFCLKKSGTLYLKLWLKLAFFENQSYAVVCIYSRILLLRPPKIENFLLVRILEMQGFSYFFLHFLHPVSLSLETTFGTVQKWSLSGQLLRPLLALSKSGLTDHFWTAPKVVLIAGFYCILVRWTAPWPGLSSRNMLTEHAQTRFQ